MADRKLIDKVKLPPVKRGVRLCRCVCVKNHPASLNCRTELANDETDVCRECREA